MARQLKEMNKAKEFIDRLSKFHNGRKCRLSKDNVEFAVNLALEQVREEIKERAQYRLKVSVDPDEKEDLVDAIDTIETDKIINNLKI